MTSHYLSLLSSDRVKAAQEANGSRETYARHDGASTGADQLTGNEAAFIMARDSFYMATAGADGWPYLQHRGGPPGFVKVLDAHRLALADFRGNRQYISIGNATGNDKVALFFMDYPRRARLKVLARMHTADIATQPDLVAAVSDSGYRAKVERALVFDVEAFDWNCPQHITPRYTLAEIEPSVSALKARIADLEAQLQGRSALPETVGSA